MEKTWYQSKAMWSGILLFLGGIATLSGRYIATGEFDVQGFTMLLTGSGIIGIRQAV